MQNPKKGLAECYIKLIRLPKTITSTRAVNISEFSSFEPGNTSQHRISSGYSLTCKPPFDILSNTSAENTYEPYVKNIKIEIIEATDRITAVNLKQHYIDESGSTENSMHNADVSSQEHMLNHVEQKPFACSLCEFKTVHKKRLNEHMYVHAGDKSFACSLCEFKTAYKKNLKKHMDIHTGEKPFKCAECEYSARDNKTLKNHNKRKHTFFIIEEVNVQAGVVEVTNQNIKVEPENTQEVETETNSCPICNKNFANQSNLKRHLSCHTGGKRFECDVCHNRYTTKNSLEYHLKSHTGEKPFPCTQCDYSAKTNKQVREHYNRMHIREEVNVEPHYDSLSNIKSETLEATDPFTAVYLKQNLEDESENTPIDEHKKVELKEEAENVIEVENKTSKAFVCPTCNKNFSCPSKLKRHMVVHTGEKRFECDICQNRYSAKESLEYHLKSHTGEKPFRCMECDYSAKTNKQVREHYNRMHIREEVNVEPHYDSLSNIKSETLEATDPFTAVYLKQNLEDEFENTPNDEHEEVELKEEAENVIEVENKTSKAFVCTTCNKNFPCPSKLKRHMLVHTGEKRFECHICQNRYTAKESLEYHLKSHTGEKPFRCTECDYSAKTMKLVRYHYTRRHASVINEEVSLHEGSEASGANHPLPIEEDREFECQVCEFKTTHETHLKKHMIKHLSIKLYPCSLCKFKATGKYILKHHMRIHTGEQPYTCNLCEFKTAHSNSFKQHMRIHTDEKVFACGLCRFKTASQKSLEIHMFVHTDDKPFACSLCNFKCAYKSSLKKHMQKHTQMYTTGEKTFACSLCKFKSLYKQNFKKHMRIHSGEKPFACNLCEYRSVTKGNLEKHMNVHTGEKPFACHLCEFKTVDKGKLQTHVFSHTGEKPFACNSCSFRTSNRRTLKYHVKLHTRRKVFVCKVCRFKTPDKRLLMQHNCSPESSAVNIKNEALEVVNTAADSS